MKKILFFAVLTLSVLSCDIYPTDFRDDSFKPVTLDVNTSIASLKSLYKKSGNPVVIEDDLVIGGQVISSDQSGNIYRSLYIQDNSGAIELKIGKSSLYNDYKIGQWVYVKCRGLALGQYGGMVQLGYRTDEPGWLEVTPEYETAYIDVKYLIDAHVFRGEYDTPLDPVLLSESGLKDASNYGKFVRVEGLTYGNEVFTILYDKSKNSTYLRDGTHGIKTWAMSKEGFKAYMCANGKETPQSAFDGAVTSETWQSLYDAASAYNVSQYFKLGSTDLQVRTSGYAKFADTVIDKVILNGTKVNFTGILTYYNGNIQFTLLDLDGVEITN